jgi:hypothetical protein
VLGGLCGLRVFVNKVNICLSNKHTWKEKKKKKILGNVWATTELQDRSQN